ncbi:MAG: FkbM family methyltransferase [Bryobacterales bacterium]|nr:FkbM family methyltransferase [Bryobacterales bacterium]
MKVPQFISSMRERIRAALGVDRLEEQIHSLQSANVALEKEVDQLRKLTMTGRQVQYVDFKQLRVFMYAEDLSYRQITDPYKHQNPPDSLRDLSQPHTPPALRFQNPREPLMGTLLSHHWLQNIDFCFFDIGCQYGTSAMATAQIILASGRSNHVYAFDPGVAGQLAPHNIRLNGMEDRVTFYRSAVSNTSLPGLLFSELGHSENNRVVNRELPTETLSYVTPRTTIDHFVGEHNIHQHLVLKIDTQGGEVEVFQGMRRTRRERLVTCLTEFSPLAIETRVPPGEWLTEVAEECTVFDVGQINPSLTPSHKLRLIAKESFGSFVENLRHQAVPYTDLLLIPNALPGFGTLFAALQ